MQTIMPLHKGFTVSQRALSELEQKIRECPDPLRGMTLRGLAKLGMAVNAGAFTIGQFMARKPFSASNRQEIQSGRDSCSPS
jgi:hypothetical protein